MNRKPIWELTGILLLLFFTASSLWAQSLEIIVRQHLETTAGQFNLTPADISGWRITDQHISRTSGIRHIYIRQQHQGLDIISGNADLHLLNGKEVLSFHNQFYQNISFNIDQANTSKIPKLNPTEALESAARQLGYDQTDAEIIKTYEEGKSVLINKSSISLENIPAKLVYQADSNGNLKLAWDMSILELNQKNWWSIRVDASSGKIIQKDNWILNCSFDIPHSHTENNCTETIPESGMESQATIAGSYRVFALPTESPNHGPRSLVSNPEDLTASPYGWHDTNGINGPEYTITRGNNVYAQEDRDGNNGTGYSPDGGPSLNFDFPLDLNQSPISNENPNITNLFYWNNIIHDISYRYGFDELSGNFQENNYSRGGLGGDFVYADAQDGSGVNNANFATPPDGNNPRMQMFLWTGPDPDADGDLDNGIILHEYAHGISNRLTGGPSTTGCLSNAEQMGEGWSDFFGVILTMNNGDLSTDPRGIGTYALNEPVDGDGIRTFPYSTDMNTNPHTYSNISSASVPHGVGSVWCAMLWEMTWALIEKHGYDDNFYSGTGGNNIALQLVMEGMKLQPCSPGFVDGRDAILKADTALYGGANSCLIWNAFAKRGLGYNASQGSSNSISDGIQSFDLPPGLNAACTNEPVYAIVTNPTQVAHCPGADFIYELNVLAFNGYVGTVNLTVGTLPPGVSANISPNTINSFPATAVLTISNTENLSSADYSITINGSDGNTTVTKTVVLKVLPTATAPQLSTPPDNSQVASLKQTLQWQAASGATSYDLQLATDVGFTNLLINVSGLSATNYVTSVLNQNSTYYWRVRSNSCALSSYSPVYLFSTASPCGQSFTDSGGSNGNYQDNELQEWIFCPDQAGEYIRVSFSSFNIEPRGASSCWDHLTVYDGVGSNTPLLGQFCGTTIQDAPGNGVISATNPSGCLTFIFDSDGSVVRSGWESVISCLDCPEPIITNIAVSPENCPGTADGQVTVTATFESAVEYILSPESGSSVLNTTGIFSNLVAGNYSVSVRVQNNNECISAPYAFTIGTNIPKIEELKISDRSCGQNSDAAVTITSTYPLPLDYELLPGNSAPLVNNTGIFSNLPGGNYTASVRVSGNPTCRSADSLIVVDMPPPATSKFELCLEEQVNNGAGLRAICSKAICNQLISYPGLVIDQSNTTVCESFEVSGHTSGVTEIWLSFKVKHTWVGDLSASLESPDGTIISLFDSPGIPSTSFGCSQNNLNLIFSDTASNTAADLENTCNRSTGTTTYAIEGAFQPVDLFSTLNGTPANGTWTICFYDSFAALDHGSIEEITFIVNPTRPSTHWWDSPSGGNLVFKGETFDPILNGDVNPSVTGDYTFWADCHCLDCPSERMPVVFSLNGGIYYPDNDGDGYGQAANKVVICEDDDPPEDHVTNFLDCDDNNANDVDLTINDLPIPSGTYQANNSIESAGTVEASSNRVIFQARTSITLKPGFQVKGGQFHAYIGSCQSESAATQNIVENASIRNLSGNQKKSVPKPKVSLNIFPNPFSSQTKISVHLTRKEKVSLKVYDSFGRLVHTVLHNKQRHAGKFNFILEGNKLSSGIYLVVLSTQKQVITRRVVQSK